MALRRSATVAALNPTSQGPSDTFVLPGLLPDALPFALRTTAAMLLAYGAAFAMQVSSASTAGVCVAVVSQPAAGAALAKGGVRLLGTVVGGFVGVAVIAAVPQDRTLLLAAFAVWLAACTFVSTLLRDYRSYGAALSGYTVGIIAIGSIDQPSGAFEAALNRVAAMCIGIVAVMLVNSLFGGTSAFTKLVHDLRERSAAVVAVALTSLKGGGVPQDVTVVQIAAGAVALQAQALAAAGELPDGRVRTNGAHNAIAAMLTLVSHSRAISAALRPDTAPSVRDHLASVAATIADAKMPARPPTLESARPADVMLIEFASEMLEWHARLVAGLRILETGDPSPVPLVRLGRSFDVPHAVAAAVRAGVAVAAGSAFCIVSGWQGASLVLIQLAAFAAMLGAAPNPRAAAIAFVLPLVPIAIAVGVINFILLPQTPGFMPFALAVGPLMFIATLATRQPSLARWVPTAPLFVALLLAPSNAELLDLQAYVNTVLLVAVAVLFTLLSFDLIFRVSPTRRFARVAFELAYSLRRSLGSGHRTFNGVAAVSKLYDRMVRASVWMGKPTPGRLRLLHEMFRIGELDVALGRAHAGLDATARIEPSLLNAVSAARHGLLAANPGQIVQAATALASTVHPTRPVRQAIAGLMGVAMIAESETSSIRLSRKLLR